MFSFAVVDCGSLNISGGEVFFSPGTTVNSTATYTCLVPLVLMGNQERLCLPSGEWTGSDPTCEGKPRAHAKFVVQAIMFTDTETNLSTMQIP